MGANPPVVYLLHGDDEIAISQFVANIKARLGDPVSAALSITTLDGHNLILDELVMAINIPPFLTDRRLVIFDHPLAAFPKEQGHKRLIEILSNVPVKTALVLVEHMSLTSLRMRQNGEIHWLEKWALDSKDRVYLKEFKLPGGGGMVGWIQKRARESSGHFSGSAAEKLLSRAGDDVRVLDQEIQKLLMYVGEGEIVSEEDVLKLTPYSREGDIFELVDAIGNKDRSRAERVYHRLLKDEDPAGIFGMVVRQFRLLLLGKEILTNSGTEKELIKNLNLKPFVARKIATQAGRFRRADLEWIYHRLMEIDLSAKSSDMDVDLGVDLLIVELMS